MFILTRCKYYANSFFAPLSSDCPSSRRWYGLDSLQVALNALAVLFLVELDNVWYAIVFQEDQKQYLSSVELTENLSGTSQKMP